MPIRPLLLIALLSLPAFLSADIIFQAGNSSIVANKADILDAALGRSRAEEYVVHLEFTIEFGRNLFLFTSKNLGKPLTIKAFGTLVGKPKKLEYSYTDRIQITNLNKKEAELLVNSIKEQEN
ncbi:hypothetical protein H0A36_12810 [Endozoicomonas sp. SM1973]|uniref:Uncharacterized protein n=1 Tax=Spartinivicinus marinus TaxID=2994442 RepID=A0A853IA05_9GAMM|nr:hypothetical protein [Spartinivicinus marinus]MCX4026522.1 hypothetical protein [Spartinivicinus marinus]NYZ66894.1 hypothetical protein [Spartinivicinus marinus]